MTVAQFQTRPVAVEAAQFFPKKKPWPNGVSEGRCYCEGLAQDGRRCEIHVWKGKPYYVVEDSETNQTFRVKETDWVVAYPSRRHPMLRRYEVYSAADFTAKFEAMAKEK